MIAPFEKEIQPSMFAGYRGEDNLGKAVDVFSVVIPAHVNVGIIRKCGEL